MTAALLALAMTSAPPAVHEALDRALAVPGARVRLVDYSSRARCDPRRARVTRPLRASGRVAVEFEGTCRGWAWARVEVVASVLVIERDLNAGEALDGAVRQEERILRAGRRPARQLPSGAVAARTLAAGHVLEQTDLRAAGAGAGEPVEVRLRRGPLMVSLAARVAACARGRVCAVLPSGKRVEGVWEEGRLVVEMP